MTPTSGHDPWAEELDLVLAAAERIEKLELAVERDFDRVHAEAEARGDARTALRSPEFRAWMSARSDTNAAWGRWYEVMNARPADRPSASPSA